MTDKIHIVLASDENYRPGLEVTKASIERSCSDPGRLAFHIFDETALDGLKGLEVFSRYNTSKMPYLRLFLPDIMSDVDWVVYSDVDTIWNRDVCELAALRDESVSIQWVRDFETTVWDVRPWLKKVGADDFDESRYACSGICIMNLKKMRKGDLSARAIEIVKRFGTPPYADQDVLNLLYNKDCELLPDHWDVLRGLDDWRIPAVYHLTGVGRHFHDVVPPTYPPQYQLWWRERMRNEKSEMRNCGGIPLRTKVLAATWPLHGLACLLPLRLRERIVRQWFFAKVLSAKSRNAANG